MVVKAPEAERERFYERMAARGDWDESTNPYETGRRLALLFEQLLPSRIGPATLVLDAGSGGGHFSEAADARGARVVSLDLGLSLLRGVRERVASECVMGSVLALPLASGSFELVISTECIEHTPAPLRALGELARVLRPGGSLVVTSPGRAWQPVVRGASALGLRPYQGPENFLWPRRAAAELERAGVEVEQLRGFNLLPLFHPAFEPLHRRLDRLGKRLPWLFVNWAILGTKRTAG